MTEKELKDMEFNEAVNKLSETFDTITSYDALKTFIIKKINEDMFFVAIHLLKAIEENPAEFYDYDYCMGTLDKPIPLENINDLKDYCE